LIQLFIPFRVFKAGFIMSGIIGILGGIGPWGHIAFEQHLLAQAGKAKREQDYPAWLLLSLPSIPDRTAALLEGGPSPVPMLLWGLQQLAMIADLAVLPCITAHAFYPEFSAKAGLPILHLIDATILHLASLASDGSTIGLLATTGTLRCALFPKAARRLGVNLRWLSLLDLPDGESLQEQLFMQPIYGHPVAGGLRYGGIKNGFTQNPHFKQPYQEVLDAAGHRLRAAGADLLVAGCSELSLAMTPSPWLIDPLAIAAREAIVQAQATATRVNHRKPCPSKPPLACPETR
jgi:aspartate racemase